MIALSFPAAATAMRTVYVNSQNTTNLYGFDIAQSGALGAAAGSPFSTAHPMVGIGMTPDGAHLYVSTNNNEIEAFNVAANGALSAVTGSPFMTGSGPQFLAVTPDGRHLYVANAGGTISAYSVAADGSLTAVTGSPFAGGGTAPVDVAVTPDGAHLYVVNRTSGNLSAFNIAADGSLTAITGSPFAIGTTPEAVAVTPDGSHLYVSNSVATNNLHAFNIAANGSLSAVTASPFTAGPSPQGIATTPDGRRLYVANTGSDTLTGLNLSADGSVSPIPGSPFSTGDGPFGIALTPDSSHLYVANGTAGNLTAYNVTSNGALSAVTGSPYTTGTMPRGVVVTPDQAPTSSFSSQAPAGRSVGFDGTASSDPDGTVASYDWDFGDGSTLPNGGAAPTHIYSADGTYAVKLTVTDNEGCSTTAVYTGHTTSCNGAPSATTSRSVTVATSGPDTPDASPPTSSVGKIKCSHKHRCKIEVSASDVGGGSVAGVAARITGKVKSRSGGTHRVTKTPEAKASAGGFEIKLKLKPGRYKVETTATDTNGNTQSPPATQRFRVKS